jgi:hypothetical protein
VLGTQQLTSDRPGEQILTGVLAADDQTGKEAARTQRRDGESLGVLAGGSARRSSPTCWSSRRGSGGSMGSRGSAGALMMHSITGPGPAIPP